MNTASEQTRIELKLPNDPRAISAVSGAVEHLAQRAGFPPGQRKDLVAAAEEVCHSAFRRLGDHDTALGIVVQEFSDRIEIILEHSGDTSPAIGLEEMVAAATPAEGASQGVLARMDRVQYQTIGGVSRTTLIKFIPAPGAKS